VIFITLCQGAKLLYNNLVRTSSDIFSKGGIIKYKKNDTILSPKISPRGIYQIKSGFVYSYSLTSDYKKRIQSILKPGEIFPLLWAIAHSPQRFYTKALTDVTLSIISKDLFLAKLYKDKDLTRRLIEIFAEYLNMYVERVENLELKTSRKKIIGRILHFSSRFGVKKNGEIYIQIPVTHNLIAQSINLSRENVTRELSKLEKEKLINFKKGKLAILDLKRLKDEIDN